MSERELPKPQSEYWNFEDRVAFVSGVAGGIGRATALAFAQEGTDVVVADIHEEGNRKTASQIEDLGRDALPIRCDLRDPDDVEAALEYAETDLRINAVCPGIVDTSMMDRVTEGREGGRQAVIDHEPIGRMGEPDEIANAVL